MKIKYIAAYFLILLFSLPYAYADISDKQDLIEKSNTLFKQGKFADAGKLFEKELQRLDKNKETALYLEISMKLAECYKSSGYHQRALSVFKNALPALKQSRDMYLNIAFLNALADLYFTIGDMEEVGKYLIVSVEQARQVDNPQLLAAILNDLGNAMAWYKDYENALAAYEECLELTLSNKNKFFSELRIKALINKIRVLCLGNWFNDAFALLDETISEFEKLSDDYYKAANLLALHSLIDEFTKSMAGKEKDKNKEKLSAINKRILNYALKISLKLQDYKLLSYCYGYIGELYERQILYEKAEKMTRKAIFFIKQIYSPEILYLWQWQMGRIFAAQNKNKKALVYYRKSVETLEPIRSELFSGYRYKKDFFNTGIKPVYLGLAELLLKQETSSDISLNKKAMLAARDTMERLKTAELQDFFQDECSVAIRSKSAKIDRTPKRTALLYPISLQNKLVLLATFPDGIKQKEVFVTQKELKEVTLSFRKDLQDSTTIDFFQSARKLYDFLIKPLEKELKEHQINSLIIAPDGALRMIPFSSLHDGKKYLIENYAVGTISAINLTEVSEFDASNAKILLTGLSDSVQEFPALQSVEAELKDIKNIMNAGSLYFNTGHNFSNLTHELQNNTYSVVHIATHGVFGGSAEKTFLLLYDDKLNMNQLSQLIEYNNYKNNRVELLTLSACQTALGDERAALGLAGVAVKAGVKSVIATLWFVDDEATSLAIQEFYRQWRNSKISKIQALQNAQKMLISIRRYSHPAYWAPFLLIGNWL